MFLKTTLLASGAFLALAAPALAQTTTDSTDVEGVVVTGSYTINERIDTATGLGLSLRETPQSVTVVTAQRILDQNLQTVADVVIAAAGVSANEVDDVRNTFNARGFEINNYQVDGVPTAWTLAGGAGETMADASIYERVEIVRGATGLLTGAGDPGASINLVRKHADATDFTGYVNASVGSWNNYQISADVAGALTANGAVRGRAVAKYQENESYIDRYKNEKAVFYGVIDADLNESTLLRVGASHQQGSPTAPAWGALPSFYEDGTFAVWSRSKTASADWSYWDTQNQNIFANLSHKFANGWELKVNYNWLRNAEKTEILYLSGIIDNSTGAWLSPYDPTHATTSFAYPFKDDGESIQNSIDVQLKGDYTLFGREHEFVLGALHSKQTLKTTTFDALSYPDAGSFFTWDGSMANPGFSSTGVLKVDEETKQTGVYGSTRFNVSDRLKVIVGGRLSKWDRSGVNYDVDVTYGSDNVFVPYAGVLYDLTPNHRVYASYTEIFQPQNAVDAENHVLDPVTGNATEIGLKSAFFDNRLQTSVAVFKILQDNLAEGTGVYTNTVPPKEISRAVEGATSKGFELEVIGRPLDDWNVSFSYSMFKAEDASGADYNTDHPRQLVKLFTTYRLPGELDRLTVGGGVNWMSKAYSDGTNLATGADFRFQQKAYALVSLMARYEVNDALSVQANVENLTDETYYSQVGFYSQYRYGAPRNYTVSLKYAF